MWLHWFSHCLWTVHKQDAIGQLEFPLGCHGDEWVERWGNCTYSTPGCGQFSEVVVSSRGAERPESHGWWGGGGGVLGKAPLPPGWGSLSSY